MQNLLKQLTSIFSYSEPSSQILKILSYGLVFELIALFVHIIFLSLISRRGKSARRTLNMRTLNAFFFLVYFVIFFFTFKNFKISETYVKWVNISIGFVFTFLIANLIIKLLESLIENYVKLQKETKNTMLLKSVFPLIQILVWLLAVFVFLDNIGVRISALITGLGIGGVAVALAAQSTLGDFLSYLAIIFERLLDIGDFITIVTNNISGTVEKIGVKTTRIRSMTGEEIVLPNQILTSSTVKNYGRLERRGVLFRFSIPFATSLKSLKEIPNIVRSIITSNELATFDRANLVSTSDSSFLFEVFYYVETNDYNTYLNINERVFLKLKEALEREGITFAYPTQKILLTKEGKED